MPPRKPTGKQTGTQHTQNNAGLDRQELISKFQIDDKQLLSKVAEIYEKQQNFRFIYRNFDSIGQNLEEFEFEKIGFPISLFLEEHNEKLLYYLNSLYEFLQKRITQATLTEYQNEQSNLERNFVYFFCIKGHLITHANQKFGICYDFKKYFDECYNIIFKYFPFDSDLHQKIRDDSKRLISRFDETLKDLRDGYLRNYLATTALDASTQEALFTEIEKLVVAYARTDFSEADLLKIEKIAAKWTLATSSTYRGRVIDWVKENFAAFIPGLTATHLRSNMSLYNTFATNMNRKGRPDWLAGNDETLIEAKAALTKRRSADRGRKKRLRSRQEPTPT